MLINLRLHCKQIEPIEKEDGESVYAVVEYARIDK